MDILERLKCLAEESGTKTAFKSVYGSVSYEELWRRSGVLAELICERMKDNKDPVVVYGHKDPTMIICFIACVRSGRAYCPVDISMPADRIAAIIETIGEPLILIAEKNVPDDAGLLSEDGGTPLYPNTICYDEITQYTSADEKAAVVSNSMRVKGDDVFYIIFTSGTTGKPKGVQITTDNLNNYLNWAVTLAGGIEDGSVFLNQAPYSFDLSVMDLYPALAVGGTVASVDKAMQQETALMLPYIAEQGIHYWVSTPSFADLCLADSSFDSKVLPELRAFLFCGEVLTNETAKRLMERFPYAQVINTYGPTESTVCVTDIRITEEMADSDSPLPIGLPKPGTDIVIDPEAGEMIIIGDTVSPGYFRAPDLTDKAFFMYGDGQKRRAYHTGDKGHYDENGMLFCDGRIDNQIKLHGYRIEIEDIEANLVRIEGVRRGAVAPRFKDGKADSLTAFVVRDPEVLSDDYAGRKAVRTALRELLPAYMVPKRIVFMDDLPMTGNGKLDRKALRGLA